MSGGTFNYEDNRLAYEIFGYGIELNYGIDDKDLEDSRKRVKKQNRFEDIEISELIYDVFCLIHSLDYYNSGDTDEETYRKDVQYFKDKWFNVSEKDRYDRVSNYLFDNLKEELKRTFNLGELNG